MKLSGISLILLLCFGLTFLLTSNTSIDELLTQADFLPTVGSAENLNAIVTKALSMNRGLLVGGYGGQAVFKGEASQAAVDSKAKSDFSSTNVQVTGVDEADIVKTDGEYVYQINDNKVIIARIYPGTEMKLIRQINFDQERLTPFELLVDEKYLIVIGNSSYRPQPMTKKPVESKQKILPEYQEGTVKVLIYDITNKSEIKLTREIEIEGRYLSARKIGSALYLVSNKGIRYYGLGGEVSKTSVEDTTPSYRDSLFSDDFTRIGYDQIRYFPDSPEPSYLIIAGIDLDNKNKAVDINTYLGAGQTIYSSLTNLYVAVPHYEIPQADSPQKQTIAPYSKAKTVVYKFALGKGKTTYRGKGEVPGTVLNQFSLDEYQGNLRIATTTGDVWRKDQNASKNNIYVLDEKLKPSGKLEDLAPGERIYSVRFMGNRAYLVTFKKVDPLFVLDLKDPSSPKVLGKLKIPGYSDYLHPYDETHLIGFGKDAVDASQVTKTDYSFAYYQGLKLALFDVSDVSHPKEMFREIIGDRGTDSELLHNHKALLFSKEKNLLAFPVTVFEKGDKAKSPSEYGEFVFQGAYVYNLDLKTGFTLRGKITHTAGTVPQSGLFRPYSYESGVERVLYINDTLYTLSKGLIQANSLKDLSQIGSLAIK